MTHGEPAESSLAERDWHYVNVTVSDVRNSMDVVKSVDHSGSTRWSPTRRVFLRSTVVLSTGAATAATVAACGDSAEVTAKQKLADQLLPQVASANADATAAMAAVPANPDRAAALTVIAQERSTHARALTDEITRLDSGRTASASSSAAPSPSPPTPPTIDQLRVQLIASARSAGDLAVQTQGYVAGLLGSISAGTTTAVVVQLS